MCQRNCKCPAGCAGTCEPCACKRGKGTPGECGEMKDLIAWLDLETTGLDPSTGMILEIGIVITNGQLKDVGRFSHVCRPTSLDILRLPQTVVEMHSRSGLFADIIDTPKTSYPMVLAKQKTLSFLNSFEGIDWSEVPLGGCSVGFDRAWLKKFLPEVEKVFSHRNVDVSSFRELARRWSTKPEFQKPDIHRSLHDCYAAIRELQYYRNTVFSVK